MTAGSASARIQQGRSQARLCRKGGMGDPLVNRIIDLIANDGVAFSVREFFQRFPDYNACITHIMQLRLGGTRFECSARGKEVSHHKLATRRTFVAIMRTRPLARSCTIRAPRSFRSSITCTWSARSLLRRDNPRQYGEKLLKAVQGFGSGWGTVTLQTTTSNISHSATARLSASACAKNCLAD